MSYREFHKVCLIVGGVHNFSTVIVTRSPTIVMTMTPVSELEG